MAGCLRRTVNLGHHKRRLHVRATGPWWRRCAMDRRSVHAGRTRGCETGQVGRICRPCRKCGMGARLGPHRRLIRDARRDARKKRIEVRERLGGTDLFRAKSLPSSMVPNIKCGLGVATEESARSSLSCRAGRKQIGPRRQASAAILATVKRHGAVRRGRVERLIAIRGRGVSCSKSAQDQTAEKQSRYVSMKRMTHVWKHEQ